MTRRRIAIYDLDETLTRHATYTPFLAFAARRLHSWRLLLLPAWVLLMLGHAAGLYARGPLKQMGFRLLIGRADNPKLPPLIGAFADQVVAAMPTAARDQWDADAKRGSMRIIATAALALYAEAIAVRLGADAVIATAIAPDGRLDGANCHNVEKHRRVLAWLAEGGINRSACDITVWSDSKWDAPLLDWADHAMLVTSSARGRQLAATRGWAAVTFSG